MTAADRAAAENRLLLRTAMEAAGFVGIESEWWHFEWGTYRWSQVSGEPAILIVPQSPPSIAGPASSGRFPPSRQPVWESGVAQVFTDPQQRAASLQRNQAGHYYARTSHPTLEALGNYVRNSVMEAEHVHFTESGLAACIVALKSLMPLGGCVVYDAFIYYEVERELIAMAVQFDWRLIKADFTDTAVLVSTVAPYDRVDVFFCDTPRNWWLECLDVQALSFIAKSKDAVLVVDTSVQPLQQPMQLGADVNVCSLSKYPSLGLTVGGMILSNAEAYQRKFALHAGREGHVLSPDAAVTIWCQILSLRDRMFAVSAKAEAVAAFLGNHKRVQLVRLPNKHLCGGLVGGQVSFHAGGYNQGAVMERLIGQNSISQVASLHLACTFGGAFTTFEHFASNIRARSGVPREATNEAALPNDIIRLGIGCEPPEEIIADLEFLLNMVSAYAEPEPK